MAAIYIHIPFCKRRCIYCDFFSTTQSNRVDTYTDALILEMSLRHDYIGDDTVNSIYFGGGTPSQLREEHISAIFKALSNIFRIAPNAEITFEANPDDMTEEYAHMLSSFPINRISMGVQSFNDDTLSMLHRRHNASQALIAVDNCLAAGFTNLSIDLIYGLPGQSLYDFEKDLHQAFSLPITHLSAYSLSYEEGTELWHLREENKDIEAPDTLSLEMYQLLMAKSKEAGFQHYEISNFSIPGFHSRHNSSYWDGTHYLGLGASAHSFNGKSRQWNIANIDAYIKGVNTRTIGYEIEHLSNTDLYNEFVQTRLRTSRGIEIAKLTSLFGEERTNYLLRQSQPHISARRLILSDGILRLTRNGIFTSDDVISDLFFA